MKFVSTCLFRQRWHSLLALFLLALTALARADEVTVRASVNRTSTAIGEPIQYQIKVSGARRSLDAVPEIKAEGLSIRYLGPSENSIMRFSNGSFTAERSVTLVYQVTAEKSGSFTIPAVSLQADGKPYRTEPIGLTVQPNTGGADNDQPQAIGFVEIVAPKKTAYIGEMIPVEVRLYVDARVRWEPVSMPDLPGEGFTKQKMPEPKSMQIEKNGRNYDLVVFRTAITPSRAGKITLGPSEIPYNARVPRARRGGPRSLLDTLGDDIFGDPMFSSTQQFKAKIPALEITVKPLPAAGRPASFSGAVGKFQFTAEGAPQQVKIGDPVTMKLRVSGLGNFDRMSAPVLKDPAGWRTYPPSSAFKADEDKPGDDKAYGAIGYAGTKTFEMAVVPETKKTAMPAFEFSYFDPVAEKYVSLTSEPAALEVQGTVTPAATPAPATGVASDSKPPAKPEQPNDIHGLRYDLDSVGDGRLLYERREFFWVQGGMGLALLAFLGLKLRRTPDEAARAAANLRREKMAAWARLRGADLGFTEFFETAARVAQIETALATGRNAASIDAATVRASPALSEKSRETIDDIFSARAELLYAGGGSAAGSVSASEKDRVFEALTELEGTHGRN